jgi:hypothetical protein
MENGWKGEGIVDFFLWDCELWQTWFYSFPDFDHVQLEIAYGYVHSDLGSEEDSHCSEDEYAWQMMGKSRRRTTEEVVEHYLGSISTQNGRLLRF